MGHGAPRRPGWLIDEQASAGRENLDAAHVARYDAKMDAEALDEVALLQSLGLGVTSTVLDLGAGTGQFALAVAPACRRVVAVDVSPVMQERLRAKVAASGHGNIECVTAGFLTYEHAGDPVDVAYSRFALHHLPDFWKSQALVRLAACMEPGAVLRLSDVVYGFQPGEADERIERWCDTATGDAGIATDWIRSEFEEHIRDEHSTFTWLLEPMIERAGFRIDDAVYSENGMLAAYVARRAVAMAQGVDIRWHTDAREELRDLFALAEDSPQQLDGYLQLGRVLAAVEGDAIVGHAQIVESGTAGELELRSLAVVEHRRRRGIGRALVQRAIDECHRADVRTLLVATAAADTDNLRFYQLLGFRMLRVERDAFTTASGYPDGLTIDAIALRDRVWLSLAL